MDFTFSVKDLFQIGGFTMYILTFCSILVVAVLVERFYLFYKFKNEFNFFKKKLRKNPENEVITFSSSFSSLITDIGLIFKADEMRKEKLHRANMTNLQSYLDKNLPVLATIGGMAPFIGLFGTVLGIIKAFRDLSVHRGSGIEVVGVGIAEALVCTAAGLLVAIIAVIFYNILKTKTKRIVDEFDVEVSNFLAGC
ncbi:MotA/TolQ/ExbB proton channel family protein [Thermodesulfobacteriota bacterium]